MKPARKPRQFNYDLVANNTSFNPSSLALSPDSSGGPVTPAKYFLALDGVKGDSLDSNHKGWFEIIDFDIELDNLFAGAPGGPGRPRQSRISRRSRSPWTAIPDWRRCWSWRRRVSTSMVRRWSA